MCHEHLPRITVSIHVFSYAETTAIGFNRDVEGDGRHGRFVMETKSREPPTFMLLRVKSVSKDGNGA